jgi:hypothetical protein
MLLKEISVIFGFLILAISQPVNSEVIDATFSWTGSNNYVVRGQFSFDNDAAYLNEVTFGYNYGTNGALKNLSWEVFQGNSEIYSEVVMVNSVVDPKNHSFDFKYLIGNEFLTGIDTGASDTWFAGRLPFQHPVALEINTTTLSGSNEVATVQVKSLISSVAEPSSYAMIGLVY